LDGFSNYRELLRNKQYRKQWIAVAISNAGTRVHQIALLVLVFEMTGKALDLGVLMICMSIPAFLMAPVAGILIDRIDRKTILVAADFARAALVAVLPFTTELWQIYAVAGALGACGTFYHPAMFASVPKLVSEGELVSANSLQMTTMNVVAIIAPAAAGLLVARVGTTYAFWFDSATYIVSGILIWTIATSLKPERKTGEQTNVVEEVKNAAKLIFADKALVFIFVFFSALILFTSGLNPLFLVLTKNVLGQGTEQYGYLISALGVGGILGGFIFGAMGNRFGRIPMVVNLLFLDAVLIVLMGALPLLLPVPYSYYGTIAVFFLFGAMGTIFHVNIVTLLQERVPDDVRGKFFAAFGVIFEPLSMLSMGAFGFLADRIMVAYLFIGSGVAELLVVVVGRFLPVYNRIKDEPPPQAKPETLSGVVGYDTSEGFSPGTKD
jgi:MFS family permease